MPDSSDNLTLWMCNTVSYEDYLGKDDQRRCLEANTRDDFIRTAW